MIVVQVSQFRFRRQTFIGHECQCRGIELTCSIVIAREHSCLTNSINHEQFMNHAGASIWQIFGGDGVLAGSHSLHRNLIHFIDVQVKTEKETLQRGRQDRMEFLKDLSIDKVRNLAEDA